MALSDYNVRNREVWTATNAEYTAAAARDAWARDEITWGVFNMPESEVGVLGDVRGLDVVELGCGTAYISAWFARSGARPVALDLTPAQLETARRLQAETGLEFPLLEASAEDVPLPDASFDLVVSEYGASIWCDPSLWVAESARLLRPGGQLIFVCNSPLAVLCTPDEGKTEERLLRPQFDMYRFDWPGENEGTTFHLAHGEWIGVLRENGFEIERLVELQAPPDATDHTYYDFVSAEWARRWPAEDLWVARKRA